MSNWVVDAALTLSGRLDLAIVGKATVVLALALVALRLASRARASLRHLLVAAALGTVLILPIVVDALPPIMITMPVSDAGTSGSWAAPDSEAAVAGTSSIATLIYLAWAVGATLLVALLAIDLRRLHAMRRGGLPWPARAPLIQSLADTGGVRRRVEVLLHQGVNTPMTYGLWRPVILLPVDATAWPLAELRRALAHELEHVRRGDWATQLIARFACACYWFHPLVWVAWRRLCLEAERACDDAAAQTAERAEYAEQLVNLARRMSMPSALTSLAMANRSDLSTRILSLLDETRGRGRVGRTTAAGVFAVACLLVLVIAPVRAIEKPLPPTVLDWGPKPMPERIEPPTPGTGVMTVPPGLQDTLRRSGIVRDTAWTIRTSRTVTDTGRWGNGERRASDSASASRTVEQSGSGSSGSPR